VLEDLDALKDSFLATVSHELNTPLTVLKGFTNLLHDNWDQLAEHDRRDAVARMQTPTRWLTSSPRLSCSRPRTSARTRLMPAKASTISAWNASASSASAK